jgi:hypothetical protein
MVRLLTTLLLSCSLLLQVGVDLTLAQSTSSGKHRRLRSRESKAKMPCDMGSDAIVESGVVGDTVWRWAAESKDEGLYYNRLVCLNNTVSVWIQSIVKGSDDLPGSFSPENISKQVTTSMARYELRCKAAQIRVIKSVEYDPRGRVTESKSTPNAKWEETVPDSVGERILKSVCEGEPLPHPPKKP